MDTEIEYGIFFDGGEDYYFESREDHPSWRRWHVLERLEPNRLESLTVSSSHMRLYEGGYVPLCGTRLTTESFLVQSEVSEDGILCRKCAKAMRKTGAVIEDE